LMGVGRKGRQFDLEADMVDDRAGQVPIAQTKWGIFVIYRQSIPRPVN
jgi:hypothetical protein